jgi:hypothetical protein
MNHIVGDRVYITMCGSGESTSLAFQLSCRVVLGEGTCIRNDFLGTAQRRKFGDELSDPMIQPDMSFYQKLVLLTQLKAADANVATSTAIAAYTRLLTGLTNVIAAGMIVQAVFAALTYLHPSQH